MPWIYTYLDAARNDTEMGPYETKEEAEEARATHASFGALTMPIMEVPKGYVPFKSDYENR